MKVYDLDINEQVDILKIGEIEYKIGDIPPKIIKEITEISTVFTSNKAFFGKWVKVIEKILKIRNKEVNIDNLSVKHIEKIIKIISNRIQND